MRLVALLSWYDESSAWLAELVASLAVAGVDHIVAVDGAYAAYPDATANSGSEQAAVVMATACGAGMGCTVHLPREPWAGGEIEKRSFLFAAAHLEAEAGKDWLWIVDGDEVVSHAPNIKAQLEATDMDAAECTLWEGVASGEHEWNSQWLRMMFRAQPSGITVIGNHACYVTGDGQVAWDNWRPVCEIPAVRLEGVRVRHRPGDRPAYRQRKRNDYYNRVKSLQLEKTG